MRFIICPASETLLNMIKREINAKSIQTKSKGVRRRVKEKRRSEPVGIHGVITLN